MKNNNKNIKHSTFNFPPYFFWCKSIYTLIEQHPLNAKTVSSRVCVKWEHIQLINTDSEI